MKAVIEIREFLNENLLVFIGVCILLSTVSAIVLFFIEKKDKALISLFISVVISVGGLIMQFFFPLPIFNPIPEDIPKVQFRLTLYDYKGEFDYSKSKGKNFLYENVTNQANKIVLKSVDYMNTFSEYHIEKGIHGETVYYFDNIPLGNYEVFVSLDGYLETSERTLVDIANTSIDKSGTKYNVMKLMMRNLNMMQTIPMIVSFCDTQNEPIENLKYEIIRSSIRTDDYKYYPCCTDFEGRCEENILIIPGTDLWIAYINPYDNKEYKFLIKTTTNNPDGKIDINVKVHKNGKVELFEY